MKTTYEDYASEEADAIINGEKLVAPEMLMDRWKISRKEVMKIATEITRLVFTCQACVLARRLSGSGLQMSFGPNTTSMVGSVDCNGYTEGYISITYCKY